MNNVTAMPKNAENALNALHEKAMALRAELNERAFERTEVIDGALIALFARLNAFFLGKPGTGKSYIVRLLCNAIEQSNYFEFLLMRGTKLEELFGPLRLSKLQTDQYVYNTVNRLPEATIAFLDEIWKSSSAILNSLLMALNEHKFVNDGISVDIPLQSCFSASNELPEDSSLDALYDRFHLRYEVGYIADSGTFKEYIKSKILHLCGKQTAGEKKVSKQLSQTEPIQNILTLDELQEIQNQVLDVDCSNVDEILSGLREKFMQAGLEYSDRRWGTAIQVLMAAAWLAGRQKVEFEDAEKLEAIFWDRPEQKREVRKIVLSFANPDLQAALAILDDAQSVTTQAIKTANDLKAKGQTAYSVGGEANKKLKELRQRLERFAPSSKRDEIITQIRALSQEVQMKCLDV